MKKIGLVLIILIAFFFSTRIEIADEPPWVIGGAKFEQAILDLKPANTYVTEVSHRLGVTVLWTSSSIYAFTNLFNLSLQFPQMLVLHRFVFSVINLMLFGLAILVLRRYCSVKLLAIFASYMLCNRYFLLQGRSSWLDQFLVLFGFLATIFWIRYLEKRRRGDVAKTGIFNGLAFLTKYAGWYYFPVIAITTIAFGYRFKKNLKQFLAPLFILLIISLTVFVVLYPAMWVDPEKALLLRFHDGSVKAKSVYDIWDYLKEIRYLDPTLLIGSFFVLSDFIKKKKDYLNILGVSGVVYLAGLILTFLLLILLHRLTLPFLIGFYRYTFPAILPLSLYTFYRGGNFIKHQRLWVAFVIALFLKELFLS